MAGNLIKLITLCGLLGVAYGVDQCLYLPLRNLEIINRPSPHAFTMSAYKVSPGSAIEIQITSHSAATDKFKEFLVQAKDESGNLIGRFTRAGNGAKTIDCLQDGVQNGLTNANTLPKTSVDAVWEAPSDVDHIQEVNFFYTISDNSNHRYKEQKSPDIILSSKATSLTSGISALIASFFLMSLMS